MVVGTSSSNAGAASGSSLRGMLHTRNIQPSWPNSNVGRHSSGARLRGHPAGMGYRNPNVVGPNPKRRDQTQRTTASRDIRHSTVRRADWASDIPGSDPSTSRRG